MHANASDAVCEISACELSLRIHRRELSCAEVMTACLGRIDTLNPRYNAVVSLQPRDALLAQAVARDAELARGEDRGWMHGFPIAIKDLASAAGLIMSMGSPLLAQQVSQHDTPMVARMKAAGGIVIGKTNTPEFGLGSHTDNPVFGLTRNAYDPSRSAGGSSGGAAVSLALRLQPVADGSDLMGSLRNPAAWNNVFGLRPSAGRVPGDVHAGDAYVAQLATNGPMGRSVRDMAMLLSVQAGWEPRQPLSVAQAGAAFALPLERPARPPLKLGWLGDLNGYLAMEPGILEACENALKRFAALGAEVTSAELGFAPERVWQTWLTWRHFLVAGSLAPYWTDPAQRALLKPEACWECEQGAALSAAQVYAASVARTAFTRRMVELFDTFDLLVLPSAQVWPFPAEPGVPAWPREIAGRTMDTYHRWMEVVIYATLAGKPALSVPAGFDARGLPMGMQLIGPPLGDLKVLQAGAAYEQAIADWLARRPPGS
jgi:amidase